MASSVQQDNGHLKSISSNPPCFFKIILQDTIRNGKLGIPRKFVKIYGKDMSSPVLLRVPSGEVWKVELIKGDDKIWLENGWLEFSNHYSLDFGHLLFFRYDGNSNFHVVIFDRSASEVPYAYTSNNHNKIPELIINESKDGDSIDISENISPSKKMGEKLQLPCTQPHKMISTNSTSKTECTGNFEFLSQQVSHNGCPARVDDKRTRRYCTFQRSEAAEVLERASKTFMSENPFFLVAMQPSYIGLGRHKSYRLTIPRNFVEKHCSVILCNKSGKTWIVTFKKRQRGKKLNSFIQAGWATFVQDNNIQVSDVCAFELRNSSTEISFNVRIYQGHHANCHQSLASTNVSRPMKWKPPSYASRHCPERLTAIEKAKAFQFASASKSENPFFVVLLHPSYVHSNKLNIPMNFARKHLRKMHKEVILLLSNGKSWPVMYNQERIKRFDVYLHNGWHRFAVDNNLEIGDVCAFELIKGAETSMKVTIYKKQPVEDANLGSSSDYKCREKQAAVREILAAKTETPWTKEQGDMFNLHNQHLNDEPTGEILDGILMSKSVLQARPLVDASQSYQILRQNEAIQDASSLD